MLLEIKPKAVLTCFSASRVAFKRTNKSPSLLPTPRPHHERLCFNALIHYKDFFCSNFFEYQGASITRYTGKIYAFPSEGRSLHSLDHSSLNLRIAQVIFWNPYFLTSIIFFLDSSSSSPLREAMQTRGSRTATRPLLMTRDFFVLHFNELSFSCIRSYT